MSTRTVRVSSKGAASAMATLAKCAASVKAARARNSSAQNDDPKRQRTKNAVAQEKIVKERACKAVDNEGESLQELAPKLSKPAGGARCVPHGGWIWRGLLVSVVREGPQQASRSSARVLGHPKRVDSFLE